MNTFTFIIGSMDDFESLDELIDHFEDSNFPSSICNCSSFEFEAPEDCDQDTVVMIGRGMAFSNDWCMDHTVSTCINGSIVV
jgi:hypothetical protein